MNEQVRQAVIRALNARIDECGNKLAQIAATETKEWTDHFQAMQREHHAHYLGEMQSARAALIYMQNVGRACA